MLISLHRILIGFSIATVLGVAMGVAIGRYRIVRELSFPSLGSAAPDPRDCLGTDIYHALAQQ